MRRSLFCWGLLLILTTSDQAFAFGAIACGKLNGHPACVAAVRFDRQITAFEKAVALCRASDMSDCSLSVADLDHACYSLAYTLDENYSLGWRTGPSHQDASDGWQTVCPNTAHRPCKTIFTACEASSNPSDIKFSPALIQTDGRQLPEVQPVAHRDEYIPWPRALFNNLNAVANGVFFGIGIAIVLVAFAYHAAIENFIVHGNLPFKLPIYAEDIQVLFKRSQRVNWYGRVVFGVTARLGMTEKQLSLVRRYWLGRVIAFDSLRRQRQNELARLHVQFAMQAKSDPRDKKSLWSRLWATFRTFIKRLFWIFTALFNVLFGFLFIRVTLAKLAKGKLIESKNLVLVLQAKEAIEESARYLKEYLITAETFDGREELFESK